MTARLPKWIRVVRDPGQYPTQRQQVTSASDVMRCLGAKLGAEEVEVFTVVMLDAKNSVLALQEVTRGILSSSLVHPREVSGQPSLTVLRASSWPTITRAVIQHPLRTTRR